MQEVAPSPVLPRLDRLDRLLQLLEEKHSLSARHDSSINPVDKNVKHEDHYQCKPLSSALEEVQYKGTLMERLALLENRVLQLSLEMDEGISSKSSSSTIPEKLDPEANITLQGSQSPVALRDQECSLAYDAEKKDHKVNGSRKTKKGYKRLLGWFHSGCN